MISSWSRPAGVEPWIDTDIQLRNNSCYDTGGTVTSRTQGNASVQLDSWQLDVHSATCVLHLIAWHIKSSTESYPSTTEFASPGSVMVQAPALTELPEVYSNILNFGELLYCQQLFENGAWKMTNWSGSKPTERRFWFMDLQEDPMFTDTIFQRLRQLTGKDFELRNVYANGQTFGHDGDFHTDGQDASHWTFLIYASEITDGGLTLFRIPGTKLLSAVEPIRNTGVLFHANLVHRGLAPSRECDAMRVSIAYKLRERSVS